METKDIYTAAGGTTGGSMETKTVLPGYVPAPVVNPDFVAPEEAEQDGPVHEGADDKQDSGKGTTASKATSTAKTQK